MNEALQTKLQTLPKAPGCYLFKDDSGVIIYVGKAKVLANRVRSYFHAGAETDERIQDLIRHIADVEIQLAPSETEALLLEYRLIKQWKPWFNSQLIRDARPVLIRVDTSSRYPSLSIADGHQEDGAEYFGGFHDVYDAQEAIDTLGAVWHTPVCKQEPLPRKACLYYGMEQCSGPCVGAVSPEKYQASIAEVIELLQGGPVSALDRLTREVAEHSQALAFEKAALAQKKWEALQRLHQKMKKLFFLRDHQDAVILVKAYRAKECVLFYVQNREVVGRAVVEAGMRPKEQASLVRRCLKRDPEVMAEGWPIQCLTEIYADKRYDALPNPMDMDQACRTVQQMVADFLDAGAQPR